MAAARASPPGHISRPKSSQRALRAARQCERRGLPCLQACNEPGHASAGAGSARSCSPIPIGLAAGFGCFEDQPFDLRRSGGAAGVREVEGRARLPPCRLHRRAGRRPAEGLPSILREHPARSGSDEIHCSRREGSASHCGRRFAALRGGPFPRAAISGARAGGVAVGG